MDARLIVNPVAGKDAGPRYLELLNDRLRTHFGRMDLVLTIAAGDAGEAAAEAVQLGCAYVFVAGGDGTLNEVLNGLAAVEGAFENTTLGVIPLGTGNDFATGLGLPVDIEEALDALGQRRHAVVDLGLMNGRRFVNVSAGGFFAEVSHAVNPQLKSIAGRLAYVIGGAQALLEAAPVAARISMTTNTGPQTVEGELLTYAVCNSRTFGGGHLIAPEAVVDDGWLDVCLVHAMSRTRFVQLLPGVSRGNHLEHEDVEHFRVREVRLEFDRTIKVNTDGEVMEASRCEYAVQPRAVRFLTGATGDAFGGGRESSERGVVAGLT